MRIKRVYEPPSGEDGLRVLVDRLWPRGVSRKAAAIDLWMKEAAPSDALRRWFAHDPKRWEAFRRRYEAELLERAEPLAELQARARAGRVTLVYAARDKAHNQAVILRDLLVRPASD
ncbi:uncharacterized protein YeaO (DUF488 family) [Rhodoblastus acidophilus]|uniref:DUF488 domain-containing protein n=1 Tax=Rhodoblastus acidophilus TaxID=1074 RepID=UPI002224EFFC|nr:DUF488 family protein [Rhodoblastus acidophilus]MCW2283905.1 uncharacterized protein YeaO (DUF488 family) [Rhodoblastus acidophilus]MCW2332601.1 uncharacterized protein YeaO (DUF488 family) [Rhodoblastus acidophilus]